MTASIFVRFEQPGFHRWPDAPQHRGYLRDLHRHLFKVMVIVEVDHDEREVEFHDLLDMARNAFDTIENGSCETMARNLGHLLSRNLNRSVTVIVSEDGECGAVVEVKKEEGPKARRRMWPTPPFTFW